jgi:hypothetical protein
MEYAKDVNGVIHRFDPNSKNTTQGAHWNGSTASGRSVVVPKPVLDR